MGKIKILFLCTGNSCRSQMAEGWARHLQADHFEPYSAGIEKHGINRLAVDVMAEAGVDISRQKSKVISELPETDFDFVITVCDRAAERCPVLSGKGKHIHQSFPDPPTLAEPAGSREEKLVYYRKVRDSIRDYIDSLPHNLMINEQVT